MKITPPPPRPNPRKEVRERGYERIHRGQLLLVAGLGGAIAIFLLSLRTRSYGAALAAVITGIYEWVRGAQQVRSGVEQPH